jgi:mRNA interferase YafQ
VRQPIRSKIFKRDVALAEKRGWPMEKSREILDILIDEKPIPAKHKDYPLKGDWAGCRDPRIEPDWVLIYAIEEDSLRLARTGRHVDVFDKY